jgi:hypothetical protein
MESWSGALLLFFQPNEEWLGGAQAMIDDGLYDKIPPAGPCPGPTRRPSQIRHFGSIIWTRTGRCGQRRHLNQQQRPRRQSTRRRGPYPRSCAYPRPHSHPRHRTERDDVSDMSPVSQRLAWCRLSSLRRYDRLESHNPAITQGYDQPSATVLPNTRGVLP